MSQEGLNEWRPYPRLVNLDMITKVWPPPAGASREFVELTLIGDDHSMRLQETFDELIAKLQSAGAFIGGLNGTIR
jgi:hypothetical protein